VNLTIPDPALVLLIGPSGSGKSTFAGRSFGATQVVSSDRVRELLSDDPGDQGASAEAFQVLALIVNGRLKRRLMTVVDATNLRAANRKRYRQMASRYGLPTIAVAFDMSVADFHARNAARPDRFVDDLVVEDQAARMPGVLAALETEGYATVYRIGSADAAPQVSFVRAVHTR
jgi:predicted kinase